MTCTTATITQLLLMIADKRIIKTIIPDISGGDSNQADWTPFSEQILRGIDELPALDHFQITPISNILEKFTALITKATETSIPKDKKYETAKSVPWWNKECRNSIKDAKKAFRNYKKHRVDEYMITYKQKRAIARRTIKQSKREYWHNFTSSLTLNTPLPQVWHKIRRVGGTQVHRPSPKLTHSDGSVITNPQETANFLAINFAANSDDSNYSQEFKQYRENYNIKPAVESYHMDPINRSFTMNELYKVFSSCGNTSPGPDDIPNAMIRNLPDRAKTYLSKLYNYIWINQVFPDQ